MNRSVLVVDDEPGILELAAAYLRHGGFTVRLAATGERALQAIATQRPDIVVLDLGLPDMSGEEVCVRLRRQSAIPILMLTARTAEADRLRGLALGADDYLTKPFSPRELVARVRAILRRAGDSTDLPADLLVLDGGRLEIDLARHEARLGGEAVPLTVAEFRLLAALVRQPGRVYSRVELIEHVRGRDQPAVERTVDVHVMRLRRKLARVDPDRQFIETVYGVGYRFEEDAP